ncbi:MAG: hypothetical protein LBS68_00220 [Puniceicoccales bacterium]|jgi:predicted  nucleic acid-binding Zn-ribbon protein|nr:hypothetical protein [Puniceicoccales bacterium]
MNLNLRQLLLYQEYDMKLQLCLREEEEHKKLLRSLEEMDSAEKDALEKKRTDCGQKEGELRSLEGTIGAMENRLKNLEGKKKRITTEAQADAIGGEMAELIRGKALVEERYLECLEALEADGVELEEACRCREKHRAERAGRRMESELKRKEILRKVEDLRKKLDQIHGQVGKPWMAAYGSLRGPFVKLPYVVQLDGVICSGCHMHLAANLPKWGENFDDAVRRCEFCNRILYVDDGDSAGEIA